jgi:hypothetical protein
MIIFISSKQIKKNFRKWGIKNVSEDAVEIVNKAFYTLIKNEVGKWIKKNKTSQHGGRVLMPQEYFGIPSNHYIAEKTNTDFSVTESTIRPAIVAHMDGGASTLKFDISLKTVNNTCADVCATLSYTEKMPREFHKELKNKVEDIFTQFTSSLKRIAKQEESINKKHLNKVLSLKKYTHLS